MVYQRASGSPLPVFPGVRVLLLRSSEGAGPWRDALTAHGFRVQVEDVIAYRFTGEAAMLARLARPQDYDGLILTSPRTADAWKRTPESRRLLARWTGMPTYAVGPRTAQDALELGLRPEGQDRGSAGGLADYIIGRRPRLPLLFCSGSPRRPELPGRLAAAGIALDECVVYRSEVEDAPPMPEPPEWVVFFSPRVFEAAIRWDWPWDRVRVSAVGSTTARVATEAGLCRARAGYADPEGLADRMAFQS